MYGVVAQLGEHLACTEKVTGSIPVSSTKKGCISIVCSRESLGIAIHNVVRAHYNPETFNVLIH